MSDRDRAAGRAGWSVVARRTCRRSHLDGVAPRVRCDLKGSSDGLTPVFIRGQQHCSSSDPSGAGPHGTSPRGVVVA